MTVSMTGEPRYRVVKLRRWPLPSYGVTCGNGTWPVFTSIRLKLALLVRELLEGACNDGGFIVQQRQLPEGMKHCIIQFLECDKGHGRLTATNWVPHFCPWCRIRELEKAVSEYRTVAGYEVPI